MRHFGLALAACVAAASAAAAATPDAQVMAPIHQFVDAFNTGDDLTAALAFAPEGPAIIDEIAPHLWTGPNALQAWSKALAAHDKAAGVSGQSVALGEATREVIGARRAYVVANVVYAYKARGTPMREPAQMAVTLKKGPRGWLITGWTWVGTTPQPTGG